MKTFHELYESCFCKEIGRNITGEQRDKLGGIYLRQVGEEFGRLFG
jgi:hypothetical protein